MRLFAVADELDHHVADGQCPACWEAYPSSCRCGGLIHASAEGGDVDLDGNPVLATRCDQCGRTEDQLDEV
jgi:hypothetical protein